MKNKILRLIKDSIPYVKELRPHTKSIASTVLMQQLDYWFTPYPEKFYKFMTKPDTPVDGYKDGDSWEEEIGISVDEFRTAFDNIGVRYKSKTEYESAPDKFQGKFYCSYYDRMTRRTWYFRNHDLVDSVLDGLTAIKTKKQIRQEKCNLPEVGNPNFGKLATPISRSGQPQFLEVGNPNFYKLATPISNLYTEITTEKTTENTTKKKEADFVFSEIRDLKEEALDENINSTDNAKSIQDPIPPTPLSVAPAAPEKIVKPLPPDPMGDRFRAKKNKITSWWTRLLADKAHTEWLEIVEHWADTRGVNADLEPHFKESLITATIQHLKTFPKLKHDLSAANTCLENYIRNDKVTDFKNRVKEAIAIEEADLRLESMKITKPECTTTYWYLWGASANAETIHWIVKPVSEDALEEERKDRQVAVLDNLLKRLSDRGLLHLAIEGKHKLHSQHVTAANLTLFPEMIQSYGTYLRNKAQQLQGAIAA